MKKIVFYVCLAGFIIALGIGLLREKPQPAKEIEPEIIVASGSSKDEVPESSTHETAIEVYRPTPSPKAGDGDILDLKPETKEESKEESKEVWVTGIETPVPSKEPVREPVMTTAPIVTKEPENTTAPVTTPTPAPAPTPAATQKPVLTPVGAQKPANNGCAHDYVNKVIREADCTYWEETADVCSKCGDIINKAIVEGTKKEHTLNGPEGVFEEPDCINSGQKYKTCSVCGGVVCTSLIEALGHDMQPVYTYEGDCMSTGYIDYKCSRCPESKREWTGLKEDGHAYEVLTGQVWDSEKLEMVNVTITRCSRCGEDK